MPPLTLRKKVWFGMGGLSMNLPDMVIGQWLLVRYVPADGSAPLMPAAICGVILMLGRAMEGFCNPFVGHWSDEARWPSGRRLPFMRLSILPFVAVFFLLFVPPVPHTHWINALYLLVLTQAYFLLYSLFATPYLSLLPELASEVKGRVDLTTSQSVFIMIGTFVFAAMGPIIGNRGWPAMAALVAALALVFFLPACSFLREKPREDRVEREKLRLVPSIILALKNRPCRYVFISTAFYWFALAGVIALVPFWAEGYLGGSKDDVSLLMIPFLVVNVAAFFLFNALAPRFGKYPLMLVTYLGTACTIALLPAVGCLPFGTPFLQTAVIMGLLGLPVAGFMVLPFAVLADVADYDEEQTGRRREAILFGVQGVFQKTMIGLCMLAMTHVPFLGASAAQGVTPFGLKLMALLCAGAAFAAFCTFIPYPLRERGREVVDWSA